MFFRAIPLFVVLLVAYNITMLTGDINAKLAAEVYSVGLVSGAQWSFTVSDLYIILGVIVLYIEVFKSTRTGVSSVIDHSLSMVVFVLFLIEFLVVKDCGTSTFFILGLMSLIDVIAGFTVSIVAARRDFALGGE
ncbi:MAG: hypothetical protein HKP55_02965 [Gammaproteobacteria bacterium]|jgi:hypothetical protein|nr:hypothetical protein [Gammaproteobacteria bacterium]NNJ90614.1 hypothetical protein [Gammaproteobacteria bacterium]